MAAVTIPVNRNIDAVNAAAVFWMPVASSAAAAAATVRFAAAPPMK